jgi:hypothetical protein
MPTTTIKVLRVDFVYRNGPYGPFKAYCVTGRTDAQWDAGAFQAQTTSDWAASLCQLAKDKDLTVKVVWRDGRFGREIVDLDVIPKSEVA